MTLINRWYDLVGADVEPIHSESGKVSKLGKHSEWIICQEICSRMFCPTFRFRESYSFIHIWRVMFHTHHTRCRKISLSRARWNFLRFITAGKPNTTLFNNYIVLLSSLGENFPIYSFQHSISCFLVYFLPYFISIISTIYQPEWRNIACKNTDLLLLISFIILDYKKAKL